MNLGVTNSSPGLHRERETHGGIQVEGLTKRYGGVHALDGLDLSAPEGQVLGLLGPNGAGKSTLVRILATLLKPDGGRASVCGFDVVRDPQAVRRAVGVAGQYAAVDEYLTARENLNIFGLLARMGKQAARSRAEELIERFDLGHAADRPARTYSGGMRRRLDLAVALIAGPRCLFLDEPTTGLDPRARVEVWAVLGDLVRQGTTALVTTQYLEEADQFADLITVIDQGREIATGKPAELKDRVGGDHLDLAVRRAADLPAAVSALAAAGLPDPKPDPGTLCVTAVLPGGTSRMTEVLRRLDGAGVEVADITVRRPTLDDVFFALTGKADEG
ncbi:daunorubicin/doxorubicin resistance ABC transporter ATP-binding protein DrrA [Spongiactinospora rosea]|uniref:Daunorubicin/doxorubicin resistance ABC transporter ATP-binding protein DrrA n=1 Tax=Spongiactinospora rosea TaxID=2248750 RepID=A0A366M3L1_9ACTN|nr:ATP-binding cassette domain-containing protein [Spongiactinospora rosea]RBQ20786.1 daunorubicin/doxorubicin resistance ABC transporter ATP-binding protein DrrA [Spongiactinospora rosea]